MSSAKVNIDNRELRRAIGNLKRYGKAFEKEKLLPAIKDGAEPLIQAAKMKAPQSDEPHHRYNKGGEKVATYYPGNLKRSINLLKLRYGYFVGPKTSKGIKGGDYSTDSRVDGYYAHFVEYGANRFTKAGTLNKMPAKPFMRPAYEATKGIAISRMSARIQALHNETVKQLK